ncbi:MAG: hypothetical protein JNL67_02760 [Planctomycetaceae bacterium]|nr:hypothetical protein [Planctomycetaceae bacterium]
MVEVDPVRKQKSRLVDWTERRVELSRLSNPSTFESMQIKVLGYLIERYRDSPVAEVPARYCQREQLYLNRRMIVVHEHLRLDRGQPTCSRAAAEQRIQECAQKLTEQSRGSLRDSNWTAEPSTTNWTAEPSTTSWTAEPSTTNWTAEPSTTNWTAEPSTTMTEPSSKREPEPSSLSMLRRLIRAWLFSLWTWGTTREGSDRWLRNQIASSGKLPRTNVKKLVSRVANTQTQDMAAIRFLIKIAAGDLLPIFVKLWRIRVAAGLHQDRVLAHLEAEFCREPYMIWAAEKMRELLGDNLVEVRLAAIRLLEQIGNLDDISFFGDLLRLPSEEVSSQEATAMLQAMQTLARGNQMV